MYVLSITEAPYNYDFVQLMSPVPSAMRCEKCLIIFDHTHAKESTVFTMKVPRKKIEYGGRGVKSFNQCACPSCGSTEIHSL